MNKIYLLLSLLLLIVFAGGGYFIIKNRNQTLLPSSIIQSTPSAQRAVKEDLPALSIEKMRLGDYPGSEIKIEQNLVDGTGYKQYLVSYLSEGLKINGLLTVPKGERPEGGWPGIVFNHGYIPPEEYRTLENYASYVNGLASKGYVVFKPDYRGHGRSEGLPEGGYFSNAYTIDVLNALASLKQYDEVNPEKIGMYGHSLGGFLTLKSMVVVKDIKAGVIWGGVVGSYKEMYERWFKNSTWQPSEKEMMTRRVHLQDFIKKYGEPSKDSEFWNLISPINYVSDISAPIQLHHGIADETVPYQFSDSLEKAIKEVGGKVEYYKYEGGDHNLSGGAYNVAMQRSVEFFDKILK